jgi:hypothetical protein
MLPVSLYLVDVFGNTNITLNLPCLHAQAVMEEGNRDFGKG